MRKLLSLLALVCSPAAAQDCQSHVGTAPQLTTIHEALSRYDSLPPRGEAELQVDYEARVAATLSPAGPLVIPKAADPEQLEYDAGRGALQIRKHFFDNLNMPVELLWEYEGPFYESGRRNGQAYTLDVVIEQALRPTAPMPAVDDAAAAGGTVAVDGIYYGVFEHTVDSFEESLLVAAAGDYLGELAVPPAAAPAFLAAPRAAFVAVPRSPWKIDFRSANSQSVIRNPLEVSTELHVLFADLQCALILAPGGEVVAAYPTR